MPLDIWSTTIHFRRPLMNLRHTIRYDTQSTPPTLSVSVRFAFLIFHLVFRMQFLCSCASLDRSCQTEHDQKKSHRDFILFVFSHVCMLGGFTIDGIIFRLFERQETDRVPTMGLRDRALGTEFTSDDIVIR